MHIPNICSCEQVNQSALTVDVAESDVGDINHARLKLALTIGAFLVEDQVC